LHKRWQLKFFRLDHRDQQIREQSQGNQPHDEVFHKVLEFFAAVGVQLAGREESHHHSDVNNVCHAHDNCTMRRLRGNQIAGVFR
jgi:hypothetical protein